MTIFGPLVFWTSKQARRKTRAQPPPPHPSAIFHATPPPQSARTPQPPSIPFCNMHRLLFVAFARLMSLAKKLYAKACLESCSSASTEPWLLLSSFKFTFLCTCGNGGRCLGVGRDYVHYARHGTHGLRVHLRVPDSTRVFSVQCALFPVCGFCPCSGLLLVCPKKESAFRLGRRTTLTKSVAHASYVTTINSPHRLTTPFAPPKK